MDKRIRYLKFSNAYREVFKAISQMLHLCILKHSKQQFIFSVQHLNIFNALFGIFTRSLNSHDIAPNHSYRVRISTPLYLIIYIKELVRTRAKAMRTNCGRMVCQKTALGTDAATRMISQPSPQPTKTQQGFYKWIFLRKFADKIPRPCLKI